MSTLPTNFAKVDGHVWRGARPDAFQAKRLVDDGVRTVINLEWEQDDAGLWPPRGSDNSPVKLVRIRDFEPLPFFAPSLADEHVVRALAAVQVGPPIVYVHCRSGQTRTGVVIAAYQLLVLGWPLDTVIANFKSYRGFWAMFDVGYIRRLARVARSRPGY